MPNISSTTATRIYQPIGMGVTRTHGQWVNGQPFDYVFDEFDVKLFSTECCDSSSCMFCSCHKLTPEDTDATKEAALVAQYPQFEAQIKGLIEARRQKMASQNKSCCVIS